MSSALPHKNNILNTWGQFSAWVISQFTNFLIYSLFRSYKAICSTLEGSWHVESLLRIYPPSTLQNNTFIVCGKLPRGVIENLPPLRTFKTIRLIQHMKKVDMLSHCYRFIFRPPTKPFIWRMNRLGILSHVWNVFTFPYNKARRWTNKIGTSSHVWNLRPLDHTQQYIQHMDQVDMLIHSFGFTCPVPYETLCLVYEPAWHLYLCQNVPCLPLQQDNTLNTWKERHLESFLKFTVPRPYKEIRSKKRWKLTRRVFFTVKVDTSSYS